MIEVSGNYWITTTWPVDSADEPKTRHVFLRKGQTSPRPGDVVFFRASIKLHTATPKRVTDGAVIHIRPGSGGLFCKAVVAAVAIPMPAALPDWLITYDYGNLDQFERVAKCHQHQYGGKCIKDRLQDILNVKRLGMAQNLCRVTDPEKIKQLLACF